MKLLYDLKTYILQKGRETAQPPTHDVLHERPNQILWRTSIALIIDINNSVSNFVWVKM
jgi:hypothetical protein